MQKFFLAFATFALFGSCSPEPEAHRWSEPVRTQGQVIRLEAWNDSWTGSAEGPVSYLEDGDKLIAYRQVWEYTERDSVPVSTGPYGLVFGYVRSLDASYATEHGVSAIDAQYLPQEVAERLEPVFDDLLEGPVHVWGSEYWEQQERTPSR